MWRDLQLAARRLAKERLFTVAVIALLSVGIGANTALFSLVDALLLRPLPVRDPESLVRLVTVRPPLAPASLFFYEEYEAWRKYATGLSDLIAWSEQDVFVNTGDSTERLRVHLVSGNFFDALGTRPAIGRLLTSADETASEIPAVLSYPYWQRRFQGDPAVLGRTITVEGQRFTIVGVTPKSFNGLAVETGPELRAPISAARLWPKLLFEGHVECAVAARLKPRALLESAEAEADAIRTAAVRELGITALVSPMAKVQLEPASRGVSRMRTHFSAVLGILMGGLVLLLLMVCANVAGLVMAAGKLQFFTALEKL